MTLFANNPKRTSWLSTAKDTDFPIQNIPFGVFLTAEDIVTVGTRIGDYAIDLAALHQLGYFEGIPLPDDIFLQDSLNDFIAIGRKRWRQVRDRIAKIFDVKNEALQHNSEQRKKVLFAMNEIEMQMPIRVGDYTDFYSSKEHAENISKILFDKDNAFPTNWLYMPVAYHGRSSSIVPSGIPIRRPQGQKMPKGVERPMLGPSRKVDFELEMGFVTTDANLMGEPIPVDKAEEYIFGMVLFNDWSARDFQGWESNPLGPFLSKNFASSISPWIVTLDALEPFRTDSPKPEKETLDYLKSSGKKTFDIELKAFIKSEKGEKSQLIQTNFKYLYWNMSQQLAHHTINGCPVHSGDLMASGTISGKTKDSYGCLLELTKDGKEPVKLKNGEERRYIEDFDTVIFKGYARNKEIRIGFGEVKTQLLPVYKKK